VKDMGVEAQAARFADVFNFAMWIGFVAVALCAAEWYRQVKSGEATSPRMKAKPAE